ncbi:MAG: CRISPR-associated endonuclease Cas3'' [Hyphomicrobiaceae bacterium]
MVNLAHSASFHSCEKIAPSNAGIRHLVRIAVLFHDLGKATRLFQDKLRRGLKRGAILEADAVRHELFSAVFWDLLVGGLGDADLIKRFGASQPSHDAQPHVPPQYDVGSSLFPRRRGF